MKVTRPESHPAILFGKFFLLKLWDTNQCGCRTHCRKQQHCSEQWLLQTSIYHECQRVGHQKENAKSAQFELHYQNIDPSTNKLYVKIGDSEQQLDLLTGTYTNIEDLISVINETLKHAKHQDIQFSYSRRSNLKYIYRSESLLFVLVFTSFNKASLFNMVSDVGS